MTLQATRAGLQDLISSYFDNANTNERLILLSDSNLLTDSSSLIEFLSREPLESAGYTRGSVNLSGWGWDEVTASIKSAIVSANYTASAVNVIQFDAVGVLVKGSATANKTITAISGADLTCAAHGLSAGDRLFFTGTATPPTNLTLNQFYYVLNTALTSNTFRLASTPGGSAISPGNSWTGTLTMRYANGLVLVWEQRPDDGGGNRTYTINAGQTFTAQCQLGQRVGGE